MKNITFSLKCSAIVFFILLCTSFAYSQEILVEGNGNSIADNDLLPSITDFTDFDVSNSRVFSITNSQGGGPSTLNVSSIVLSNPTDFTISSNLADNTLNKNQTEPFTISFIGSGAGTFTSDVTISSDSGNDGADNVWIYRISKYIAPVTEINIIGNGWPWLSAVQGPPAIARPFYENCS